MIPKITITRWTGKKANSKGELPVVFQTSVKGKKLIKSSGQLATKEDWEGNAFKRTISNASIKNLALQEQKAKYEREILLASMQREITYDVVRDIMFGKAGNRDFFSFATERIHSKKYEPSTISSYAIEISKIKSYRPILSITDITPSFLEQYSQHLRTLGNADNTVWKAHKFIKTMITDAAAAGLIVDNPFKAFKGVKYKNPDKVYLTVSELNSFWDVVLKADISEPIRLAGLYFLRQCYSGLRISDNMKMDKDSIHNDWINLKAQKTGKMVRVPIKNKLRKVLDLIGNQRLIITDQVYNRHLKDLAALAGIEKKVTSHTGRHTLGYLCAHYNVPPHITMRIMGHSKMETTMIYYHLEDAEVSREMDKFNVA